MSGTGTSYSPLTAASGFNYYVVIINPGLAFEFSWPPTPRCPITPGPQRHRHSQTSFDPPICHSWVFPTVASLRFTVVDEFASVAALVWILHDYCESRGFLWLVLSFDVIDFGRWVALAGSPQQFGLPHLAAITYHLISVLGRLGLHWPEARLYLQLRKVLEQNKIPFIVYLWIPLQTWHTKWMKLCERSSIEWLMASKACWHCAWLVLPQGKLGSRSTWAWLDFFLNLEAQGCQGKLMAFPNLSCPSWHHSSGKTPFADLWKLVWISIGK